MNVEIWSDIACPWCYVGKRRFEKALAEYEHADEVTVTWRSFELDPGAPVQYDEDNATRLARKYGTSREQMAAMEGQLAQTAAGEALDMRLDTAQGGNTFDGHRLVHLAERHGKQDEMKERLFRAYFTEGAVVGDHDTLLRAAADVGLPEDEVRELLLTERFAEEVREDERTASQFGITGVPFFVVDRKIAASGAQAPEVLLDLLRQGRPEPKIPVVTGGDACGPDGC
ncbi:MAG TPA: DsbA family oxidoreductase [Solirubrobacteraceae bacterium]|nr:DsbA family oxidoreductase [Solirubrobacteraceae bacterium]